MTIFAPHFVKNTRYNHNFSFSSSEIKIVYPFAPQAGFEKFRLFIYFLFPNIVSNKKWFTRKSHKPFL